MGIFSMEHVLLNRVNSLLVDGGEDLKRGVVTGRNDPLAIAL